MTETQQVQRNKPLTRIFLWNSSRSLSTVVVRSIIDTPTPVSMVPSGKTIFEPHLNLFYIDLQEDQLIAEGAFLLKNNLGIVYIGVFNSGRDHLIS